MNNPSFMLLGIGPDITYFAVKNILFARIGYYVQFPLIRDPNLVNNISGDLGIRFGEFQFTTGIRTFFNSGSLTCYSVGLSYCFDFTK